MFSDWVFIRYLETFVGFLVLSLGVNAFAGAIEAGVLGMPWIFPGLMLLSGAMLSAHGALGVLKKPLDGFAPSRSLVTDGKYPKIMWMVFVGIMGLGLVIILFYFV